MTHAFHEGAAARDPLVPLVGLPASTKSSDGGPAAMTPEQTSTLEVKPPALRDPGRHKGTVGFAGPPRGGPELRSDGRGVLPRPGHGAQERAAPSPGIAVEPSEVEDDLGPERVQVAVTDKFQQVVFLHHHDRLAAVHDKHRPL